MCLGECDKWNKGDDHGNSHPLAAAGILARAHASASADDADTASKVDSLQTENARLSREEARLLEQNSILTDRHLTFTSERLSAEQILKDQVSASQQQVYELTRDASSCSARVEELQDQLQVVARARDDAVARAEYDRTSREDVLHQLRHAEELGSRGGDDARAEFANLQSAHDTVSQQLERALAEIESLRAARLHATLTLPPSAASAATTGMPSFDRPGLPLPPARGAPFFARGADDSGFSTPMDQPSVLPNPPRVPAPQGLVTVPYVKSELNLADALTKLLPNAPKFRWAAARLHSWTMAL